MIRYRMDIMNIVKNNISDCNKAIKEVQAYIEKNKAAMEEIKKVAREMDAKMTDAEAKAYDDKMTKDLEALAMVHMNTMLEFSMKCPDQYVTLDELMINATKSAPQGK